jgi:hypothetical protein
MRDLALMNATMDSIRADGTKYDGGVAAEKVATATGYDWFAGDLKLNARAVEDLIADGWLRLVYDGTAAQLTTSRTRPLA